MGWEYFQEQIDAYKAGIANARPTCGHVHDSVGAATLGAYCDSTLEQAKEFGGDWVIRYHKHGPDATDTKTCGTPGRLIWMQRTETVAYPSWFGVASSLI